MFYTVVKLLTSVQFRRSTIRQGDRPNLVEDRPDYNMGQQLEGTLDLEDMMYSVVVDKQQLN